MKDIGKSRRRPKRKTQGILLDTSMLQSFSMIKNNGEISKLVPRPSWWLGTSGIDPFLDCPVELDSSSRELIAVGKFTPFICKLYGAPKSFNL
jgi:hypothetical protein